MRTITLIVVHCSAVGPRQQSSAADIDRWHQQRGWGAQWLGRVYHIGYHYVVRRDGSIEVGRPVELVGSHCLRHNRHSIGICYEGGLDDLGRPADTRTPAQRMALRGLIARLKGDFPRALVVGHHDLDPQKTCPCFNVVAEGY